MNKPQSRPWIDGGATVGPHRLPLPHPLRHTATMNIIDAAREPRWQAEGRAIAAANEEFAALFCDCLPDSLPHLFHPGGTGRSNGGCATRPTNRRGPSKPGANPAQMPKSAVPIPIMPLSCGHTSQF